jgi:hypothetical protein
MGFPVFCFLNALHWTLNALHWTFGYKPKVKDRMCHEVHPRADYVCRVGEIKKKHPTEMALAPNPWDVFYLLIILHNNTKLQGINQNDFS